MARKDITLKELDLLHLEFHQNLGKAITCWAEVDVELFRIFALCIGKWEQSSIIYFRQPGLNIRIDLTSEIVESMLPKPDKKSGGHQHQDLQLWKKICKKMIGLLGIRRRLAHHPVGIKGLVPSPHPEDQENLPDDTPNPWMRIYESRYERMRKGVKSKPLLMEDIKKHAEDVSDCVNLLSEFYRSFCYSHPELPRPPGFLHGSWTG